MKLPQPLDWDLGVKPADLNIFNRAIINGGWTRRPIRILSDRGISQALELGLIRTTPCFDPTIDTKRIQPATLDVRLRRVTDSAPLSYDLQGPIKKWHRDRLKVPAQSICTVQLTEKVDFGQSLPHAKPMPCRVEPRFIGVSCEARSSVRRLGMFVNHQGYFFTGRETEDNKVYTHVKIGNFGLNDVHFEEGERVAQLFFTVEPFADYLDTQFDGPARPTEKGELIRSLNMGIEIVCDKILNQLEQQRLLTIHPFSTYESGWVVVHASNVAYRLRTIEGGINFGERKKYANEELLEPIDISKGYTVQPFEHILVETQERFCLSSRVGIRFLDNLLEKRWDPRAAFDHLKDIVLLGKNIGLVNLVDGWIDPGYEGGFSRQPKWLTGRTIKPGDPIGFGQVFYFPNGVQKVYGTDALGSQYLDKKNTEFAK